MRRFRSLTLALLVASFMTSTLIPAVSAKAQIYYADVGYETMVNNRYEAFVSIFAVSPGSMYVEMELYDWSIDPDSEDSDETQIETTAHFFSNTFNLKVQGNLDRATLTAILDLHSCDGSACSLLGQNLSVNLTFTRTGELLGDPNVHIETVAAVTGTVTGGSLELFPAGGTTGSLVRDKQ